MSYPILYKANETNFDHLGLSVLSDATKCLVTRERNGLYFLEMDYPIDGKDYTKIDLGCILKCDAGHRAKQQRFIVSKITETKEGYSKIYAKHILWERISKNALQARVSASGNAFVALEQWRSHLIDSPSDFAVWSNVTTQGEANWKVENFDNAYQVLGGKQGSILDVWGGEYEFDNLTIKLWEQMGQESSTIIAYGRNLIDLEQEKAILDTYTSIYPFAIVREGEQETLLTLPEKIVDSKYVSHYPERKILKLDLSNNESVKTVEHLRQAATNYIKANKVGVPKVNLSLSYQDLARVSSVWGNPVLDIVDLCDRVKVYFEKINIKSTNAKITKVIWDVLLDENSSIEIGDSRTSFSEAVGVKESTEDALKKVIGYVSEGFNAKLTERIRVVNRQIDAEIKKIEDSVKTGIEVAKAKSEQFKSELESKINAEIKPLANEAKQVADRANQSIANQAEEMERLRTTLADNKREVLAEANQAATNAFNRAEQLLNQSKSTLSGEIAAVSQSLSETKRNLLEQANAQTELSSRVATVEETANGTKTTVTELQKTVNATTGNLEAVSRRTKTVEDNLSGLTARFENIRVGGQNLLPNADFSKIKETSNRYRVNNVDYVSKNLDGWEPIYNAGIENPTENYHAYINETFFDDGPVIEFNETNGSRNWKGIVVTIDKSSLSVGEYYFAADLFATGLGTRIWGGFYYFNKEGHMRFHSGAFDIEVQNQNEWLRLGSVLRLNNDIDLNKTVLFFIYGYGFSTNSILYMRKPKLEQGNIGTAFSLSQKDINAELATYKQTVDRNFAELTRTTQTVTDRVTEYKSAFDQTAERFRTSINALEVFKNNEGVRAQAYFNASRDETARQIREERTAISENYIAKSRYEADARGIRERFEGLSVGSNLIRNSKIKASSNAYGFGKREFHVEEGKLYWFVARAKKTGGTPDKKTLIALFDETWLKQSLSLKFQQSEYETKYIKFRASYTGAMYVESYWYPNNGDRSGTADIDWYMLVEGDIKPSDWQPHPEDTETRLATFERGLSGIEGKFTTLNNEVMKTNNFTINENGIVLQSGRTFDGRTMATMFAQDPENVSIIARLMRVNADMIVNGAITGRHVKANSIETGHMVAGSVTATVLAANAVTADKLLVNHAMIHRLTVGNLLARKITASELFVTAVQAVDISAARVTSGILASRNGAMTINLDNAAVDFLQEATIRFHSSNNAVKRTKGESTAFIHFSDDSYGGVYAGFGVRGGYGGVNSAPSGKGTFAGVRVFRPNDSLDKIELYGDKIELRHSFSEAGSIYFDHLSVQGKTINLGAVLIALANMWTHYRNMRQRWEHSSTDLRRDYNILAEISSVRLQ